MEIPESKIKFKTEIEMKGDFYMKQEGTIQVLDELMQARDDMFERKLSDGFKNLPHKS